MHGYMPLTTMEEVHVPDKGGGPSVPDKRGVVPRILGKGVFLLVHDPGGEEKEEKGSNISYVEACHTVQCHVLVQIIVAQLSSVQSWSEDFIFFQIQKIFKHYVIFYGLSFILINMT